MKEQSMYEETTIAAIATAPGEGGDRHHPSERRFRIGDRR